MSDPLTLQTVLDDAHDVLAFYGDTVAMQQCKKVTIVRTAAGFKIHVKGYRETPETVRVVEIDEFMGGLFAKPRSETLKFGDVKFRLFKLG